MESFSSHPTEILTDGCETPESYNLMGAANTKLEVSKLNQATTFPSFRFS
jgi:hypothetical protein